MNEREDANTRRLVGQPAFDLSPESLRRIYNYTLLGTGGVEHAIRDDDPSINNVQEAMYWMIRRETNRLQPWWDLYSIGREWVIRFYDPKRIGHEPDERVIPAGTPLLTEGLLGPGGPEVDGGTLYYQIFARSLSVEEERKLKEMEEMTERQRWEGLISLPVWEIVNMLALTTPERWGRYLNALLAKLATSSNGSDIRYLERQIGGELVFRWLYDLPRVRAERGDTAQGRLDDEKLLLSTARFAKFGRGVNHIVMEKLEKALNEPYYAERGPAIRNMLERIREQAEEGKISRILRQLKARLPGNVGWRKSNLFLPPGNSRQTD